MKKIVTILLVFVSFATVAQNTHTQSNANTVEQFQGAVETKVGLINAHFYDTTEANLSWIKTKPFAQIVTGDGVTWLRNGTATKWIGTGSASINISSDSTSLIICNGSGTCDTIPVLTVAPITTFNILNDTTIEVCGINSCDTIYTLPINYNQNVVNSVSVVNGVSVDSVFYFINGVKYLAGTITHSSANTSVDGLISGGIVSWSGSGLTFDITSAVFRKFGVLYNTNDTTITLDPADPTYSRIDLFALDTINGGEVIKITGTPSPTPIAPQTQDFQIALTTGITLNVGDTVPSNVSIQKIYDENIEWATSINGGITVNFNDLSNPFTGVKDALISDYNNIGRVVFTRTGNGVIDGSEVLKFHISLRKPFSSILSIGFFDGSSPSSNLIRVTSNNGFDPNKINQYQTIAIPISAFTFANNSYSRLIIYASGYDTTGTGGFYLDDVELQSGINNIPSQTDYSNKADSTTTKKLNDSTYVGLYWVKGIPYQKGDTINIHSTTIDSINVSILNGGKIDTSHLPVSKIYIQQAGAGETQIIRASDDTTLSVATLKNTDDITVSKASDSAVLFQFTHPHYTKDQIDSIKATITADGITRAELIDTANNKVNKTDVSGGTINQVLKKNSSTDYDWSWQDESGGGKDSSAIHVGYITVAGDTSIVFSDLKGNSDTISISLLQFWKKNGNKIYYNDGNVGIGTDTPSAKLVVRSNMAETTNLTDSNAVILSNADSSTNTTKPSPVFIFKSYGYTNTGARHYATTLRLGSISNTGTSLFTPVFYIDGAVDGGAYSRLFTMSNGGLIVPGASSFGGISGTFASFTSSVTAAGLVSNQSLAVAKQAVIGSGTYSDYSASMQMVSTQQGFLPPRLTKVQRDSINLVITSVTVVNGGSYTGTPTLNAFTTPGSLANKFATLTAVKTGSAITSVTITDGGSFSQTPQIQVIGGTGSGGVLKANMTQVLTAGLQVFCTDCTATDSSTGVMQIWNGTAWKNLW